MCEQEEEVSWQQQMQVEQRSSSRSERTESWPLPHRPIATPGALRGQETGRDTVLMKCCFAARAARTYPPAASGRLASGGQGVIGNRKVSS